ncbi:hypothetical protein FB451DRAFT_637551 [Mycena latifolia]|nr:hypothetical protein FB451DRAFT_637551 [Mycena latifolia]
MSHPDLAGVQELTHFLTRSGGTIKDLALRYSGHSDTEFMACLRGMPLLRRLDIAENRTSWQFTDRVWDALASTSFIGEESQFLLLPKLESLSVEGCVSFGHKSVVRMLESRVPSTPSSPARFPFRTLTLAIWRKISDSAYDRLMEFEERGLKICVDGCGDDDDETGSEASGAGDEDGEDSDDDVS